MSRNGSGTFSLLAVVAPANTVSSSTTVNSVMDDLAEGLTDSINVDGTKAWEANQSLGGFKLTSQGAGSVRTDSINYGQVQDGKANWVAAGGTADVITATYAPAITALVDGQECCFRASGANTSTTPTFSPNSLTARTIVKNGGSALVAGDIAAAGHEVILRYLLASTRWELLNPAVSVTSTASTTEVLTGTDTAKATTPNAIAALWEAGADITDGAAITIGEGGYFNLITSTTAITSFSITTDKAGRRFSVRFDTARTLTHNATSLILPGGANITTAQGDIAHVRSLGSGNVVVELYTKASVKPGNASSISQAYTEYSIANPIAIDATYTQAHGLAAQPTFYMAYVQCLSTEFGYAAGDRIPVSNLFDAVTGSNSGTTMSSDTTNVYVVTGTTSVGYVMDRANQSVNALTPANWRLYLRVFP